MKRAAAIAVLAALLAARAGTASASPSCMGRIASYEGSQLPPGSLGAETSGIATGTPAGTVGAIAQSFATSRAETLEGCVG